MEILSYQESGYRLLVFGYKRVFLLEGVFAWAFLRIAWVFLRISLAKRKPLNRRLTTDN